jgi:hypothetical protein
VNALFEAERTQVGVLRFVPMTPRAACCRFLACTAEPVIHIRVRLCACVGVTYAGVAGRVAGGDDAERDQDVGDGAVAQGAAVGLQVGEPRPVQPVRERRTGADGGGDAGRGQLQRAADEPDPRQHGRVRRREGDVRVVARVVPLRVTARVRVGGAQSLLRPAGDRLQVPALGPHGGAVQGPRRHR